jgi:hypothetical protein
MGVRQGAKSLLFYFIFIFLSGRFRGRRVGETVLAARVPMAGQEPDCADGTSRVEFDDG